MTSPPRLRHSARGLILDDEHRVLLCRFDFPHPAAKDQAVWTCPGGGVEDGETTLEGLRRELAEEVGLRLDQQPAHIWHQVVQGSGHAEGYDGIVNDYFLVRTRHFEPNGSFSAAHLAAAENLAAFRWWNIAELEAYDGDAVFSPRALPMLLRELLDSDAPAAPRPLGL